MYESDYCENCWCQRNSCRCTLFSATVLKRVSILSTRVAGLQVGGYKSRNRRALALLPYQSQLPAHDNFAANDTDVGFVAKMLSCHAGCDQSSRLLGKVSVVVDGNNCRHFVALANESL